MPLIAARRRGGDDIETSVFAWGLRLVRILHVVPTYWPAVRYGGPIRSVHALCRSLAHRGHQVEVFTTSVDGASDSRVPLCRPVEMDGVRVTYFQSNVLRRLYWSATMRRALGERVAEFDVVHTHSVFLWPSWAAARDARASNVPYVTSPRGMLVPELIRRKSRWAKSAWIALIERRNLRYAAAIHATSAIEAHDLRRFGWALPEIAIIPNGVDGPVETVDTSLSDDIGKAISAGPFVLSLGRIVWKKGLDRLIAALSMMPAGRLIVVGDDAEGHATVLLDQAAREGVADRVTIIARHVEGRDKEALFAAASAFAMPSMSENFGMAAMEALRRGVPVVVTREVGMAEIVRASGGGVVVEGNPSTIAHGLTTLLADPPTARRMGAAGQIYVTVHYGWPAVAEQMEKLYRSIVTSREPRAPEPVS
jgi:glycosyltransferase involved in cell wall biosynthesis